VEEEEESESRRKTVLIPVIVVIALVAVGVVLWFTFFSGMFNHPDMVPVPNLVGRELSEVCEDENVTDYFAVKRSSIEYSDKYDEGYIIEQDLQAGTEVEEGSTIYVVVSGGVEPITMIDVKNFDYETAVSQLLDLGLNVDTPEYQTSEDVEKDKVISYSPAQGTKLTPGDTVHLVVSSGPEVQKVTVPTVTGQSLDQARNMLTELGLAVGNVTNVDSDQPKGQVVYQSIAAGTSVEKGTALILHVSTGPTAVTQEPQQPSSKEVPVKSLPTDRDTVEVRITVGGQEAYKNQVNTADGDFTTTVTGTGVQEICIYVDGELVTRYSENFDE
jgi:serine/threonine-protein kinase